MGLKKFFVIQKYVSKVKSIRERWIQYKVDKACVEIGHFTGV